MTVLREVRFDEYGAIIDENVEFRRECEKRVRKHIAADAWSSGFRWGILFAAVGASIIALCSAL